MPNNALLAGNNTKKEALSNTFDTASFYKDQLCLLFIAAFQALR